MKRAFIIAANTLKESLRQKLILLLALVAVVLVASSNYFLKLDLGHEKLKFVFDFTSGALGFFGSSRHASSFIRNLRTARQLRSCRNPSDTRGSPSENRGGRLQFSPYSAR